MWLNKVQSKERLSPEGWGCSASPASTKSLSCLPALDAYFSKLLRGRDTGRLVGAFSDAAKDRGGINYSHPIDQPALSLPTNCSEQQELEIQRDDVRW